MTAAFPRPSRLAVILTSKTVWGVVLGAGAWLAGQPKIGVIEVLQAGGMVVAGIGARDAIQKAQ